MEIFIWMYILLFLIWGISAGLTEKVGRKFTCITSFLVLWLIQALRSTQIGTDLVVYIPSFHRAYTVEFGQISHMFNMESGYIKYNEIIGHFISTNDNIFLGITAFFAIAPIAYIIYKYSKSPALSFIIFASLVVYLFDFSGLRQAIAIGITTYSYTFIARKKIIPFILMVILATTFHLSSIIFLIAYPICNNVTLTIRRYVILGMLGIIALFSLKSIALSIVQLLFEEGKYVGYLNNGDGAYMLLLMLFLFFLYTFKNMNKDSNRLRALVFLGVLFQSLGLISNGATRMAYYFYIFFFLALPEAVEAYKDVNTRNMVRIGIASFMVFFFFYTTGSGTMGVIPYKFFWE